MTPLPRPRRDPAGAGEAPAISPVPLDVQAIRRHFTFQRHGRDPVSVAEALNQAGVEARGGCHCATLAHHALGLSPPASCRLSFYLYNTPGEVVQAAAAVAAIAGDRRAPTSLATRTRRKNYASPRIVPRLRRPGRDRRTLQPAEYRRPS